MAQFQKDILADVLEKISSLSEQYDLRVANVFHAGDGNLHPLILYDAAQPGELEKAEDFGNDILKLCVIWVDQLLVSMAWELRN